MFNLSTNFANIKFRGLILLSRKLTKASTQVLFEVYVAPHRDRLNLIEDSINYDGVLLP